MQIVVISMPQNRDGDQNGANIICATGPSGSNGPGGGAILTPNISADLVRGSIIIMHTTQAKKNNDISPSYIFKKK